MLQKKIGVDLSGEVLGASVHDSLGRVLLKEGTVLTPSYINRLLDRGYHTVYVRNQLVPDLDLKGAIKESTRAKATAVVRNMCQRISDQRPFDIVAIANVVDAITDDLCSNPDLVLNMSCLRSVDDYTFVHSVNVCVLSIILQKGSSNRTNGLRDLGMGAILHDIGKLSTPPGILLKPGRLSPEEYEVVKKHAQDGYQLLSKHFDSVVPQVALEHHERVDGSGYCQGLAGNAIHPYGRIAAVADVYDAVTSDRVYRRKMWPSQAMALLQSVAGTQLDARYVRAMTERVAHYPVGNIVKLTTGEIAVVIEQGARATEPVVRVVIDADENLVDQPQDIPLDARSRVKIREVLDDYPLSVKRQLARLGVLESARA